MIVPGLNGSADGHWPRHWLADHEDAVLVEQADWFNPQPGRWLHRLEQALVAHPGALIIAHSLGSILATRLAKSSVAPLVGGALLVAPTDIERAALLHARTYDFGTVPADRLPFPALVVASRNDPYMAFEKVQTTAQATGLGRTARRPGSGGAYQYSERLRPLGRGYDLAGQVLDAIGRGRASSQPLAAAGARLV